MINLIRSIVFTIFEIVTVIPWGLVSLLLAPFPRKIRYGFTMRWLDIAMWGSRYILGIRVEISGKEYLDRSNVILLSKHQSTWETFFYPTFLQRECCYVFKRELLLVPFFGWGIGLMDMIHINRNKRRDAFEDVTRQGKEKLAQGRWIIMFPEGTRMPTGTQGVYRSGGVRLAEKTGATIIPVAVNSARCWPKTSFVKTPGTIHVSFGPPIQCEGKKTDTIVAEVECWIETEMRRISPTDYEGPWKPLSN